MGVKVKGSHSQNKIMKIVTLPAKMLGKAQDIYVKSMTTCASRGSCGHSLSVSNCHLPKSYIMSSTVSSNHDADDFRDLIRAASVRSLGHKNEIDMLLHQAVAKQQDHNSKPLPKSCSVGMGGFMGRIDEDKADEEDGSVNAGQKKKAAAAGKITALKYSGVRFLFKDTSGCYAVGKSNVAF